MQTRWPWIAHLNFKEDHNFFFLQFQRKISICLYCASTPFTRAMFIDGWKFQIFLKRLTQGKTLKLFQNLTCHFREEDIFRISSCLCSATNNFLKRVTQETFLWNYFKIWTSGSREEDILRISSCQYSANSLHSLQQCLLTDQNFMNKFWNGSSKEHSAEIISKSDQQVQEKIFKELLKTFHSVAMATTVFDGIKFF